MTGEQSPVTTEVMLAARAVYYAMITEQDRHVGSVRAQWHDYLARTGRPGVFVYASDHGDTCGEHGVFGKQTFYEGSTRIPLVFEGSGIVAGRRIANPVSIMDIGPTLCEFAGGRLPAGLDGRSLATALRDGRDVEPRPVISEWVQEFGGDSVPGRMVRSGRWKLVHYRHDDVPTQLFDLEVDPDELTDCASEYPETVGELMQILESGWEPERIARQFAEKRQHRGLIRSWVDVCDPDVPESEQWRVTPESIRSPDPIV